jgi:predicted cobalt transporter CbtA
MTMDAKASPGPLHAVAYVCFGVGAILMLAMSFGMMRQDLALFLGASASVVGGLLWGFADQHAPRDQP